MRTQKMQDDTQANPHSTAVYAFILKHRMMALAAAVSLVVVAAIGVMSVSGLMNDDSNQSATTHEKHAEGSSTTTTFTEPDPSQPGNMPGGQTSVTVNGESVDVPENGSTSKTITNENGTTTHVDISNNSTTNGSSTSSSVRTHSSSRGTHMQNNININSSSP